MDKAGATTDRRFAVIDIGSNSVRLVVFEKISRQPFVQFNEKALCGLGRAVAATGRLADDAVARALASIARFRVLCAQMEVGDVAHIAEVHHRAGLEPDRFDPDFQSDGVWQHAPHDEPAVSRNSSGIGAALPGTPSILALPIYVT